MIIEPSDSAAIEGPEPNRDPDRVRYLNAMLSNDPQWQKVCLRADSLASESAASTPREILQQPWVWRESARLVVRQMPLLSRLLENRGPVYLTGAGSSFYVGTCLKSFLQESLRRPVTAVPSTDLILSPEAHLASQPGGLVVSFSRSGRSPESFETARTISARLPEYHQLLITCDGESALAERFNETPNASVLSLPPASCDRGLAMTSSFTSMVIAGQALGFLGDPAGYLDHVANLSVLGSELLAGAVRACPELDRIGVRRLCLLGSGGLSGTAMEGALKVLEMTDGQICTISDSFLGVRHGPLSFVDPQTLVIYFVASQQTWRKYERDLMAEVKDKELGAHRIAVGCAIQELSGLFEEGLNLPGTIADDLRPPVDVLLPQVLALRLSLASGLNPDNPSRRGAISRVVEGVTIHEPTNHN
jgi:tagatose-6-phosphate ketose/aldose isomerase